MQKTSATVRFAVLDVRAWDPTGDLDAFPGFGPADVVIANALLQWVPDHQRLLRRWAGQLRDGASLAFQVPGNFAEPSHQIIREVAALSIWDRRFDGLLLGADAVADPQTYAALLIDEGFSVDAWEPPICNQLPETGDDHPVLRWVEGTALRGIRSIVDDGEWDALRAELNPRLALAYPVHNGLVFLPFRRIFVVASRGR